MTPRPTRRSLLRTSSALTFSAVCAGSGLADGSVAASTQPDGSAPSGPPNLKTSLNAYSFSRMLNDSIKQRGTGTTLIDLLDFCAKHNFDGIDATGYFFPGYPDLPSADYVNNFKRRAFQLGVGISGTGVRNNFTTSEKTVRDAAVQHIKDWVEVAARLGAPVLRVFADTQMKAKTWKDVAPDHTRDQVQAYIVEALQKCAEQGKKFGVIIGVQNHGDFLQTADEQLALVKAVNSDWCGPIVDTGYYKTPDPYVDIAKVAPTAVNWQIKESPFGVQSDQRTDLVRLLKIIRKSGYRGYLPIETLSAPEKPYDPFTVVPAFHKQLREAIAQTAVS